MKSDNNELLEHIRRCQIYLDVALPKASEEQKAGRLYLVDYATSCGTRGCVAFHFLEATGELDLIRKNGSGDLANDIWIYIRKYYWTFDGTNAFAGKEFTLNERETNVKARLAEYKAQLVQVTDVV